MYMSQNMPHQKRHNILNEFSCDWWLLPSHSSKVPGL